MRVITPASRDVVLRRRNSAEQSIRRAINIIEQGDASHAAIAPLHDAINDLREIEVEINPA